MATTDSKYSGGIFISYRRAGVRTQTYRLVDELKRQYGESQIFLDVKSIDPGVRYADAIRDAITHCAVILVMIGPKWAEICDDNGQRRLENPADVLRIEVDTALQGQARVIPVLVDGAVMPSAESLPEGIRELADLQAFTLTESHWEYDVAQLVGKLDSVLGRKRKEEPVAGQLSFSGKVITGLVLVALVVLVYATGEVTDYDTALGGILFAGAGLVFCVLGYRDIGAGKSRGRGAAISGAIVGGLMALILLGELDGFSTVANEPALLGDSFVPQPAVPQVSPQPIQPQPAAVTPVPVIEKPVVSAQTHAINLSGEWMSDEGLTYVFEQSGNQVSFAEYNPLLNTITASGSGSLQGRILNVTYQTAVGTTGQGRLTLSADGESLSGNYTDHSTGTSLHLTLERN